MNRNSWLQFWNVQRNYHCFCEAFERFQQWTEAECDWESGSTDLFSFFWNPFSFNLLLSLISPIVVQLFAKLFSSFNFPNFLQSPRTFVFVFCQTVSVKLAFHPALSSLSSEFKFKFCQILVSLQSQNSSPPPISSLALFAPNFNQSLAFHAACFLPLSSLSSKFKLDNIANVLIEPFFNRLLIIVLFGHFDNLCLLVLKLCSFLFVTMLRRNSFFFSVTLKK